MKIDKKTLDMLSALPDDKLWQMLRVVSASMGATLPEKTPDADKMANLRTAFSNIGETDLERAMQIVDIYKGGNK